MAPPRVGAECFSPCCSQLSSRVYASHKAPAVHRLQRAPRVQSRAQVQTARQLVSPLPAGLRHRARPFKSARLQQAAGPIGTSASTTMWLKARTERKQVQLHQASSASRPPRRWFYPSRPTGNSAYLARPGASRLSQGPAALCCSPLHRGHLLPASVEAFFAASLRRGQTCREALCFWSEEACEGLLTDRWGLLRNRSYSRVHHGNGGGRAGRSAG